MQKLKINTYTDESGQDTKGKTFVVCTIVIVSDKVDQIEIKLLKIEAKSGKVKKWYNSGDKKRHKYIDLLLDSVALSQMHVFCSIFRNKQDYINLIGSHIAKTILTFVGEQEYISKIFIDKVDKKSIMNLTREIKSFHIKYKKIRGHTEESSAFIRLADTLCGMTRDMNNKNIPRSYKYLFSKFKQI